MSRFLMVDIGAGTMDVLCYDMETDLHYKAVVKSPVQYVAEKASNISGDLLVTGCDWDAAVVHYTRATREDPDNIEYRMALQRALVESARVHLQEARKRLAAEDLEGAIEEFELLDQSGSRPEVREALLAKLRSIAQSVHSDPLKPDWVQENREGVE